MSFNRWPCSKAPQWNEDKIVVCDSSDAYTQQWAVYLKSIKFFPLDSTMHRPDLSPSRIYPNATLNFVDNDRPRGLKVLLDTGTGALVIFELYY